MTEKLQLSTKIVDKSLDMFLEKRSNPTKQGKRVKLIKKQTVLKINLNINHLNKINTLKAVLIKKKAS